MDEKLRSQLASGLKESFRHKDVSGAACLICGVIGRKVALHIIKNAQGESDSIPKYFIPQSKSNGTIRGGFAICDTCAPACPKCEMPVVTKGVKAKFSSLQNSIHSKSSPVTWGNGKCEHIWLFGKWPV